MRKPFTEAGGYSVNNGSRKCKCIYLRNKEQKTVKLLPLSSGKTKMATMRYERNLLSESRVVKKCLSPSKLQKNTEFPENPIA
jgi:hypothetical protein